jgi:hypothetical protein
MYERCLCVEPPLGALRLMSACPLIPAQKQTCPEVRVGPILLKKSVDALDQIFSALLARFHNKDAEGLIARRRRDVDRSKWNCGASDLPLNCHPAAVRASATSSLAPFNFLCDHLSERFAQTETCAQHRVLV